MRFAESLWLLGALGALLLGVALAFGGFLGRRALKTFGDPELVESLATARAGGRRALKGVLLVLALGFAFLALAQPQYGKGTRLIPATDLDVVIVLDYSKSMYAKDITPSRIERAKAEVGRLIADMPGARFGAVAFAGETMAFPLTSDGAAIAQFLRQLSPNDMPVGGTAIARALSAGRELLARDPLSKDHRKVMLLVTDGEDLEGDPVEEAQAAKRDQITVFVVQVGGRTPEPIPEVNELGQTTGYRQDAEGRPLTTSLSAAGEEQLTKIAETTGGLIARSEKGGTGIDEIAARLRRLMSEELSERVETVYADVYAYPLVLALLLLLVETAIPEAPARKTATLVPLPPARRRRRKKRVLSAAATGLLSSLCLSYTVSGCERSNELFMRNAPAVDEAIAALDAGDAGAAVPLLQEYLSTGKCDNGSIGTPDSLRGRPNAAFDLGLGLFSIAEKFGRRFGEDPPPTDAGPSPEEEAQLAKRSAEIDCALRIVRLVGPDVSLPLDLRARAFYLAGNLEFLRRDYKTAVQSYDLALKLVPGLPEDAGVDGIGRDAAYNRAIALRRIEDQERDASPPDAEPDGGEPDAEPDQPDSGDDQPDSGDDKQNDEPDAGEPDAGNDAGQDGPPDAGSDGGDQPPPKPEPKQQPQANQDDRMLDELEQAPTLQQHEAKQLKGRLRAPLEDK
ncbi:MAG TPA: VWA domain-containing protein [Polyangiaceae bacterium]